MTRSVQMTFQQLESRVLLSATLMDFGPGQDDVLSTAAIAATTTQGLGGPFKLSGRAVVPLANPDAGHQITFHGSGPAGIMGRANINGTLKGVGNLAQGRATGQFVLSNHHGTITIALTGPLQPGFSPTPDFLTYQVTRGTGQYAHASGSGDVQITMTSATHFIIRFS